MAGFLHKVIADSPREGFASLVHDEAYVRGRAFEPGTISMCRIGYCRGVYREATKETMKHAEHQVRVAFRPDVGLADYVDAGAVTGKGKKRLYLFYGG